MNFLNVADLQTVVDHDWAVYRLKKWARNITTMYLYLKIADSDVEVHVVAVRYQRDGRTPAVKEVARYSVDDPFMYVLDLVHYQISGHQVDWYPQGIGRPKEWAYKGKWASESHRFGHQLFKIDREVINPEVLLLHPRYKWAHWSPACGHIVDYLKAYKAHPRIELLAKAGAGRFGTRVGFVRQLEKDKGLARFFVERLPEIQKYHYGVDAIRLANKRGTDLGEAAGRIADRRSFRGWGLPTEIDATKALAYIRQVSRGCDSRYQYCQYLQDCQKLGLDLTDTKVAYPKQFRNQRTIVADRVAELRRREQAELAKKQDAQIAAVAARFAKLERARCSFLVRLPRRTDDLIREGKRLFNCLGDGHYAAKMARGETLIAFVRRAAAAGSSFVAVEWSPAQRKVLQCYAAKNAKPPAPVMSFVNRVFNRPALSLKGRAA